MSNFTDWSITNDLYQWLIKNIPKNSKILEIGSGTGTIELSKHYILTSIEHNPKWINLTDKCKYILSELQNGWYNTTKIKKELKDEIFDVIIVDAPNGSEPRIGFYNNIDLFNIDKVKYIIIDDTHRQTEKKIADLIIKNYNFEIITELKGKKNSIILCQKY